VETLLLASGDTALARALRGSGDLYAAVNAAHILGLALLIGSILPLDLRLAGGFRRIPAAALLSVLRPVAMTGLLTAAITGAALFTVNPADYLTNPAFRLKIALLLLALVNVIVIERSPAFRGVRGGGEPSLVLRSGAVLSAGLWIGVLVAGRWIGFL
jgi:hypothetical protein